MPALFADQLEPSLSQGDVFAETWDDDRTPREGSVIVLSEGCDIEHSPTILVATVEALSRTETGLANNIRGNRAFYALALTELPEPSWMNFRTTRPLQKDILLSRLGGRVRSMTPLGRAALGGRMFSFLTHNLPPGHRFFADEFGGVWKVWEVSRKDLARLEDQVRTRVTAEYLDGWLCFSSHLGTRRLHPIPAGWQFVGELGLRDILRAAIASPTTIAHLVAAEEQARPR